MALATVTDTTGSSGLVRIRLYTGPAGNEDAFVTADHSAPTRNAQFYSDVNGLWTYSLTPNADITPSGTVYLVDEYYATNKFVRKIISVPPGGPYDVDTLLTTLPGALGGGGSGGSDVDELEFSFSSPMATWTISHGLGKHPIVQLIDDAGAQFDADVEYPDLNTVVATHAAPLTGAALVS